MSAPSIAVVIVSYRSAELTVRCLESLAAERAQSELEFQVFVIDNASGDFPALDSAIERCSWRHWVSLILAPKNGGFGYGNNLAVSQAMRQCDPKYIYLLNPDTEVRVGVTRALVDFLEGHPDVGIAGSGFENLDGSDWPIAFRFPSLRSELCQSLDMGFVSAFFRNWLVPRIMTKSTQPTDWVSGASMMVRTEVFRVIGGFDENYFLYFEETDFSFRARKAGYSTWYVPEGVVMHVSGYSTHVTSKNVAKQRLPAYWFESRRRYFALRKGIGAAKLIDIVALASSTVGFAKKILMGQRARIIPHFTRDLWRHSILRRKNRSIPNPYTKLC